MRRFIRYLLIICICMVFVSLGGATKAQASRDIFSYHTTSFGRSDGLDSIEINDVVQTEEGFVWVGTYSGLFRYDGIQFLKQKVDDNLNSVKRLFVDSKGVLWIGTNDAGVFRLWKSGKVDRISTADGLSSNYIHDFTEDEDGNVYIATGDAISVVKDDVVVTSYKKMEGISCATFIEWDKADNCLVGVTNAGLFFVIREGRLIYSELDKDKGDLYNTLIVAEDGTIFIGSSFNILWVCRLTGDRLAKTKRMELDSFRAIKNLAYDESQDFIIVLDTSSFGIVNRSGDSVYSCPESFNNTANSAMVDYQGNIWFGTDVGLYKVSKNLFTDVFALAGIEPGNSNVVLRYQDNLYIGTDNGLKIINPDTFEVVHTPISSQFSTTRIRGMCVDSDNKLWMATYGKDGIVCTDGTEVIYQFNESNSAVNGAKFRSVIQMRDGTIVAASNTSLNFIRDGRVTRVIGPSKGLSSQILSMVEMENGDLLCGSDGSGLFVIRNMAIFKHFDEDDGVENLVILRIIPGERGYFYATSGALYYSDSNLKNMRKLNKFPYGNNFDITLDKYGNAWIPGGMGMLHVSVEQMIADEENYPYTIYDDNYGLDVALTANSWSYLEEDGDFYFCTAFGIKQINLDSVYKQENDFNVGISYVAYDGEEVYSEQDDVYRVGKDVNRIDVLPAILNYKLNNPVVHVYMEGFDEIGVTKFQTELQSVSYTNIPAGEYKLHVQVLERGSSVLAQEAVVTFIVEAHLYEKAWFKGVVVVLSVFFLTMLVALVFKRHGNNMLRREKEKMLAEFSYKDALTGAWNRRALEENTDRLDRGCTVTVIFCDIMGLKTVNDQQGHDEGDRLIIRAYESCIRIFRKSDVYRVGGDEFVILCQDMSEEDVKSRVEYLSVVLEKSNAAMAMGYAWTDNFEGNFEALKREADSEMYAHKKDIYAKKGYVRGHV